MKHKKHKIILILIQNTKYFQYFCKTLFGIGKNADWIRCKYADAQVTAKGPECLFGRRMTLVAQTVMVRAFGFGKMAAQ